MPLAYQGIRILDLTKVLAGPYATMILADLGADVIKIEPAHGDDSRRLPPDWEGQSAVFLAVNRGKKSVVFDLKRQADREIFLKLVESADVVIESSRPGAMERLGLGFEALTKRNRRLIHCSISAYGSGPLGKDLPGYDILLQGFSGILKSTGHPGQPPARLGPSAIDLSAGMWAAIQIMAALANRTAVDAPQHLEVALVDAAFNLMCHQALSTLATGEPPRAQGSGAPSTAPYEVFQTADDDIIIAAGNDNLFRKLCDALGLNDLSSNPSYQTMAGRVQHREALHAELETVLRGNTVAHWLATLGAAGVPVGPVLDVKQALAHPLVAERGLLFGLPGRDTSNVKLLRLPLGDLALPGRAPPRLGEHTEEIRGALSRPPD